MNIEMLEQKKNYNKSTHYELGDKIELPQEFLR